jgi:hypothetical protein
VRHGSANWLGVTNQSLSQAVSSAPSLSSEGSNGAKYDNLKVTFEASAGSLLLVAHQGAPASLLIAPESDYTRSADSLGVSDESKIGSDDFDQKYVIRDSGGKARAMLTPEVIALVQALEPFTELELSDDMIRLLKKPQGEAAAVKDIESLAKLARAL